MRVEIPFVEGIYKEQMTLNFDLVWSKNVKRNKKSFIWAILIVLFGVFIYVSSREPISFLLIVIGIHSSINCYRYHSHYKKCKKDFFDLVDSEIFGQKEAKENSIWEFNDDYFRYKDYKYDTKIKWKAFKSCRVIKQNLFIDLNEGNNSSFVLGEIETGKESFKKISDFVKDKTEAKINN